MDGENRGKTTIKIDDLGGKPHYFRKHPNMAGCLVSKIWPSPVAISLRNVVFNGVMGCYGVTDAWRY